MTRAEHLAWCKQCTNRKMDLQQGIICSLTGKKADFEDECPNYNHDASVEPELDDTTPVESVDIKAELSEQVFEKLRLEQNLPMALISGIVVGIFGAGLWGIITVATGYQIGYMAIAIGAAVGFTMRFFGKGLDPIFGISGAIIAVLSCVLGNFMSIIGFIAEAEGLGFFETLGLFDFGFFFPLMTETFSVMDLLFYGIAGFEGYKFAFRTFTEQELAQLSK